MIVVSK